jgi:hypothetical protein
VLRTFTLVSGLAFVLFIFRFLKSLNFQERMGLVTRTLVTAITDLFHFCILYFIVLAAYAYVGYFIFGSMDVLFACSKRAEGGREGKDRCRVSE